MIKEKGGYLQDALDYLNADSVCERIAEYLNDKKPSKVMEHFDSSYSKNYAVCGNLNMPNISVEKRDADLGIFKEPLIYTQNSVNGMGNFPYFKSQIKFDTNELVRIGKNIGERNKYFKNAEGSVWNRYKDAIDNLYQLPEVIAYQILATHKLNIANADGKSKTITTFNVDPNNEFDDHIIDCSDTKFTDSAMNPNMIIDNALELVREHNAEPSTVIMSSDVCKAYKNNPKIQAQESSNPLIKSQWELNFPGVQLKIERSAYQQKTLSREIAKFPYLPDGTALVLPEEKIGTLLYTNTLEYKSDGAHGISYRRLADGLTFTDTPPDYEHGACTKHQYLSRSFFITLDAIDQVVVLKNLV
jgi:hypothetical protein